MCCDADLQTERRGSRIVSASTSRASSFTDRALRCGAGSSTIFEPTATLGRAAGGNEEWEVVDRKQAVRAGSVAISMVFAASMRGCSPTAVDQSSESLRLGVGGAVVDNEHPAVVRVQLRVVNTNLNERIGQLQWHSDFASPRPHGGPLHRIP